MKKIIAILFCGVSVVSYSKSMKAQCEGYEVSRGAAITTVADSTFECSDMIRDSRYSDLRVSTTYVGNKCMLNVYVSGIIKGNSRTCNVSREVDVVKNNMVMFTK
jgi:hypothetical protein